MGIINRITQFFGYGTPEKPTTVLPNYDASLTSPATEAAKKRAAERYNRPVQPNRTHGAASQTARKDSTDYLSSQAPADNFLPGYVAGSFLSQQNPAPTPPPVADLPSEPFTPAYQEPTAPVQLNRDSLPDYQQPSTPQRAEPSYPSLEREVSSYTPEPVSHSYHSEPSHSYSSSHSDSSSHSSSSDCGSSGGDSGGGSCGGGCD